MEMQDKEFDQLFNSKLNDFEMEPSPMVWDNIAAELDGKEESKRSIVPYWSIAASVVVLIAASVLFLSRDVKPDGAENKIVNRIKPVKPSTTITEVGPVNQVIEDDTYLKQATVATKTQHNVVEVNATVNKENTEEALPVNTPIQEIEKPEPLIAAATTEKLPTLQVVVPNIDVPLSNGLLATNDVQVSSNKPQVANANTPETERPLSKKRARGLGGLINTIVAAVDKREDKLIEFTDADNDEGAKVTAVNLGIFKIKKQ